MFNKRIIAVLLIASLFSACASRAPSNSTQTDSGRCQNSSSTKYTFKSRIAETDEKNLVWDISVESENTATFGIQQLSFDRTSASKIPYLDIKMAGKAKNIEYEAKVDKHIEEKVFEAGPGSTAFATTILLGLPLVFAPGWVADNALGCSQELSSKLVPSKTNRVPTGKEQWGAYSPNYVRFKFIGINTDPVEKTISVKNGVASFKLEDYVSWKNSSSQVNIKVVCLSCVNLRNEELGITYSDTMNIVLDVGQIRSAEAANKKKIDDAAIAAKQKADEDRAKAAERATQAKSESIAKAQAAEQKSLDQYKEKCSNLGFKVGTDAFGKCVLQLTK